MTERYKHNGLYVYDATSQTFDPYVGTITQMSEHFDRALHEGYNGFVSASHYGGKTHINVSLTKMNSNGTQVATRGDGETVEEAFTKARDNFPKNPLDGGQWVSNRLESPKETPIDAYFTEEKSND